MAATAYDGGALTVLTAVAAPSVEAQLVAGFAAPDLGVLVVRRCVDLVELLAAAAAGTARAALVSADLRGLDRESLTQLATRGLAVVGLASDESGERLLRQLGVRVVVTAGASPEQVAGALRATAAAFPEHAMAEPSAFDEAAGLIEWDGSGPTDVADDDFGRGSVLAVWGPAGAPGRTTLALGLADAFAAGGTSTLLIDADPYGGCIATLTGLLDEAPGLSAACRAANAGVLDVARLAECCREVGPGLRVLTGLSDPRRWPELRTSALDVVLSLARRLADVTVVDVGFSLEEDEELAYDTAAPRRNAATLAALRSADRILAVGSADPVGLSRLIRDLPQLDGVLEPSGDDGGDARVLVVANRLREGRLAGSARRQVEQALAQHAGAAVVATLPLDLAATDAAHGHGQLLSEAAPGSALFAACTALAGALRPLQRTKGAAEVAARRARRPGSRRRRRGSPVAR